MRILITLLLLAMLQTSVVYSQEKHTIPMKVNRNITLVTIRIGSIEIPNILLDTGFAFDGVIIYNPAYRDSIDLTNAAEAQLGGAGSGGGVNALLLDSASFELGGVAMNNQRIILITSDVYKGFPTNGIIGYSLFGHFVTAFDYDNNTITMYTADSVYADSSWTAVPLYFKDNSIPWIDIDIVVENEAPIKLAAYIDYAASDPIFLLQKPDMKFHLPKDTVSAYLGRGLSGDIYGTQGSISKLVIGGSELNQVTARFADAGVRSKQRNADAIIGCGTLRRFNSIFDYAGKTLYLKPNSHFSDPF